jgi:hypothetical protein
MGKVRCANEEACVAFPSVGEPAKLSRGNPGPMCFRCEERDFDAQQSQLVRSAETPTGPLQSTKPMNPPRRPTRNVGRKIEQQPKEPDPAAPEPDKVRCSCGRAAVTPGPLLPAKWVCELCAEWDRVVSALWHCREIIPRIEGRVVLARRQGSKRLEHLTRRLLKDTKADLELLQEELREVIHKVYPGPYNREKRAMFLQDGTGLENVQTRPQQSERAGVPTGNPSPVNARKLLTLAPKYGVEILSPEP